MVTLGSDMLFQQFMAADYIASEQVIDSASGQVTEINPPNPSPPSDQGFLERMREKANDLWVQTKSAVDAESHYSKLKQAAEQWAVHIIKLIVIFLLQTLIIPVMLMCALYAVARGAFERNFPITI